MAVTLGKRKRHEDSARQSDQNLEHDDARALFQRAFEARFKPLAKPVEAISLPEEECSHSRDDRDDEDATSDWSGLSDDDEVVEVVEHDVADDVEDGLPRQELKAFMSSKPPTTTLRKGLPPRLDVQVKEEDKAETSNLKHDLALQRLLKESHLLDHSDQRGPVPAPEGKGRIKALDLRLRDLGAKQSLLEQEKMPLAHRKGIKAKASIRETARRKEAAENGVILEKARIATQPQKRRERGIGAPSVGKFRGGTLKLSSHDVKSIERSKQQPGRKGRKR